MRLIILLYLITISIVYSTAAEQCDDLKLELVQVLLRHGARTPIAEELKVYNSTALSVYEPWGLGELNNQGKLQEYKLGQFLRNRYAQFLRSVYKPEDLYAYSSELSRTKMSLELVLAGLYPPVAPAVWNNCLKWSPIPYFSAPRDLDILLHADANPKYSKLSKEILHSTEFENRISKYYNFFDYVAENTIANDSSLTNTLITFDVLYSNEFMNLPLPDWYTSEVRETFIEIMELLADALSATTEMKKLVSGPIIKTFIENMNLNDKSHNPRKIYLYSGHDSNIASFTRSHNIKEFRYPPFGSALIFEKLKDHKGQVYVRLFAWDGLEQLTPLKLNNNEKCCHIDDYLEIVKPFIPSEMEITDMIGSLNTTQIKNLLFNSAPKPSTISFRDLFD